MFLRPQVSVIICFSLIRQLNREEAISKMQTQDLNNDTEVTWTEYLSSVYGYEPHELYDMEKDKNPQVQVFIRVSR